MPRVITKCVLDLETLKWVFIETIPYNGNWAYCLGGATAGEKGIASDEAEFMSNLQGEQATQFANEQQAQQQIQSAWSPIVAGGAYQYGFSTAEDQQLQQNIVNQGAQATANTENAALLREQQQTGGAQSAPTGAQAAINAQVAATGAQQTATNLANEKLAGYEQGSKLFSEATGAEESVAQLANPNAYAGAATSAGNAALDAQQVMQQANANSLGSKLLGGAISGGVGFLTGGPAGALAGFTSGMSGKPTNVPMAGPSGGGGAVPGYGG
jgi:hypothetical protein